MIPKDRILTGTQVRVNRTASVVADVAAAEAVDSVKAEAGGSVRGAARVAVAAYRF